MTLFSKRLKQARKRAGLTQEALGIKAGIDEMSASSRLNQYETGKHVPDFGTAERLAQVLDVPVEFFFAKTEAMADLVLTFHQLNSAGKAAALKAVKGLLPDA